MMGRVTPAKRAFPQRALSQDDRTMLQGLALAKGHAEKPREARDLDALLAQLVVGVAISLYARAQCRLHVSGAARLRPDAQTIFIFNHTSDLDIPVAIASLFAPRNWLSAAGNLVFFGRADLYLQGFLALYFPQLGPVRHCLYPLNLSRALRLLHVLPANVFGPRLVADWVADLQSRYCSDDRLAALLNGTANKGAANAEPFRDSTPPALTLGQARDWRYHRWLERRTGPEFLNAPVRRRLAWHAGRRARAQLAEAGAELASGRMLLLAPEGGLSADGSLQPFRSVLFRLLQQAPQAAVVPVGLSYDPLLPGRPSAYTRIGLPIAGLAQLPRREADHAIRTRLAQLTTITLSHLVAQVLLGEGEPAVQTLDLDCFADRVLARGRDLAQQGLAVDCRWLQRASLDAALSRLLRDGRGRHGFFSAGSRLLFEPGTTRGQDAAAALHTAHNQLASILSIQSQRNQGQRNQSQRNQSQRG